MDVKNALIAVKNARARYQSAAVASDVARQVLEAEQKKYELGASTSYAVVQHQTAGLHWPQYVNKHRLVGALVAGFAALHIADMFGYWLNGLGLPKLDFAYFNGSILMPKAAACRARTFTVAAGLDSAWK